jgi:hypothetical protein
MLAFADEVLLQELRALLPELRRAAQRSPATGETPHLGDLAQRCERIEGQLSHLVDLPDLLSGIGGDLRQLAQMRDRLELVEEALKLATARADDLAGRVDSLERSRWSLGPVNERRKKRGSIVRDAVEIIQQLNPTARPEELAIILEREVKLRRSARTVRRYMTRDTGAQRAATA